MTVQLYTSSSNASSRKARAWFTDHKIPFTERNIIAQPLTQDEVKRLLRLTENGSEDIVSTRAKIFKKLNVDLDEISTSKLIELISQHPDLLKRPIMFDEKRLQVGYNDEEIRRFLPRETRKMEMLKVRSRLAI
ncbi:MULTISPECIES: transcriptional regulator Spx [Loigolactobacillus]|uniref:Transcriptional regulator n=1 Tax=Loigolactobacillus backii TaxID=375175 RepID=A0A192H0E9_9LACO|nr:MULTISPECIES: transcriptional regulator Spx [Loigolactobacillus]ANK60716.1 transcriptional regulator [Loigolactobacillus backii]ANK61717.1 transcriptional regulator [Loigolactobacillus backii]ANK65669.1 transcriptional regulator [Loigolactobacillus backii]ANK68146.1 transcriptional regulator [Loigolactobacillus backii]ANK69086.1 transcriptional regulator [Loigolactobacillus backii]